MTIKGHRCPYRKPKQLTDVRESVDSPIDERFLQIDLVRPDRLFRPRAALEAENLVLRHQLNVLRRTAPKRVALTASTGYCLSGFIAWLPRCWTL